MTIQSALLWLRTHRHLLNLKGLAKAIRLDYTMLMRAIDDRMDSYGYPVRFPERCAPRLKALIESMAVIPQPEEQPAAKNKA